MALSCRNYSSLVQCRAQPTVVSWRKSVILHTTTYHLPTKNRRQGRSFNRICSVSLVPEVKPRRRSLDFDCSFQALIAMPWLRLLNSHLQEPIGQLAEHVLLLTI